MLRIGVISDTHGLLRPEACGALEGVDLILHAGDIGGPEILDALARIAPVTAVAGNNDHGPWTRGLPATAQVRAGGVTILITHIRDSLAVDPRTLGASVLVYGHSHKPESARRDGILFFNPGSAGPRRFKLPVTVGLLHVRGHRVEGEIVPLPLTRS